MLRKYKKPLKICIQLSASNLHQAASVGTRPATHAVSYLLLDLGPPQSEPTESPSLGHVLQDGWCVKQQQLPGETKQTSWNENCLCNDTVIMFPARCNDNEHCPPSLIITRLLVEREEIGGDFAIRYVTCSRSEGSRKFVKCEFGRKVCQRFSYSRIYLFIFVYELPIKLRWRIYASKKNGNKLKNNYIRAYFTITELFSFWGILTIFFIEILCERDWVLVVVLMRITPWREFNLKLFIFCLAVDHT